MGREAERNSVGMRRRGMQQYTDECSLSARLPHTDTYMPSHSRKPTYQLLAGSL